MTVTAQASSRDWLLLLYALPARFAHARVQAWRRLQRVGAVSVKGSAYVLPDSAEAREDFAWIEHEIGASGGQAMVLVARTADPAAQREIVDLFQTARGQDFETLAADAAKALQRTERTTATHARRELVQGLRRLRERLDETARIDFFGAPGRDRAADLIARLEQHTRKGTPMTPAAAPVDRTAHYRSKTWLTRPRPGVDRMSSAWLIRRFIDPQATFVFGDPAGTPDAIPFDTFDADLGHHGADCTFETLCKRFAIADPAVGRIAHVVHDLDLKAQTFGEPETATIGRLVDGLRRAHADDAGLLAAGMAMFEALYQSASGTAIESAGGASKSATARPKRPSASAAAPRRGRRSKRRS